MPIHRSSYRSNSNKISDLQQYLAKELADWLTSQNLLTVAYSTGADSTAVLHALACLREHYSFQLQAIHVNHQLQTAADTWQAHAQTFCQQNNIVLHCEKIQISQTGKGLEAAARDQRYNAILKHLSPDQAVLTGHHRDDQAETLLLNLLRGSGLRGLAGMPAKRRLQHAWLLRPLLDYPAADLVTYCEQHQLHYHIDSSNQDTRFERNWIRHSILPTLEERQPSATKNLARSANLLAQSLEQQKVELKQRLVTLGYPQHLSIQGLTQYSLHWQYELLHAFITNHSLSSPGQQQLLEFIRQVHVSADDRHPNLVIDTQHKLYADTEAIHLLKPNTDFPEQHQWQPKQPWHWPNVGHLQVTPMENLPQKHLPKFTVKVRQGGEKINLYQGHRKSVKKLFQEKKIPSWQRDQLPFIWHRHTLHAVGDLFISNTLKRWLKRYNLHWHWKIDHDTYE